MDCFHTENGFIFINLKVNPGASRSEITGIKNKQLNVRLTAQPQDGKANACLCEFLAKALGCAKRDIVLVNGEKSRIKTVKAPLTCSEKLKEIAAKDYGKKP